MNAFIMHPPSVPHWKPSFRPDAGLAALRRGSAGRDDAEALRSLFHRAIADLPEVLRHELALRILHAANREALWQLRPALFRAISRQFGEQIARERLERMDMRGR